ncbi:sensor histidine kinase [Paenarthrobacter histidinolovorans]|uniref:sensor histidine kinase n=1 Tax=Paenarthrobacter histidinolovorans TaxID=43664 RepID=UPI00166CB0D0|nr:histidine kinase [Paenarthrobacter histidinolovorans]GGJ22188.1 two-component sensor histidine kinase [Paenarthrobacter histidinolovorans]
MSHALQPGSRWEIALDAAVVAAFASELSTTLSTGRVEGLAVMAVMVIAALARRRMPAIAAVTAIGASGLVAVLPESAIPVWVASQVCIFSLTLRRQGPLSVALPIVHASTLYAAGLVALHLLAFEPLSFGLPLWTAAAASAGYALRSQKATIAALHEMVRATAEAKDSEIQRTLGEERIRIARDLHDAVAHNIAVINVHAGAAEKAVRVDSRRASESLQQVRMASRAVLQELQDILLILRSPGQLDDLGPMPTVEGIPALLESGKDLGLEIDSHLDELPGLDAATEAALYRVVQEALTNAHRYGDGHARLALEAHDRSVSLIITNGYTRTQESSGSGHGLIGMRERVESAGGELRLDDRDGRFDVHVTLPIKSGREKQ